MDSEILYVTTVYFDSFILKNEILSQRIWEKQYQIYNFDEIIDKIENEKLYAKRKIETIVGSTQNQYWI